MRSTRLPSWIERPLGLDPVLPPPHVFALDRRELAYGAFHHSPQGWTFERSHHEPLPEGLLAPGVLGAPLRSPRLFWELLQGFVAALPGPIDQASLILPDSWLRLTFTESEELAGNLNAREEVLRWKMKRLVPFRVEELRLADLEVTPFPGQQEPKRLMIGFAIESLLAQIEDAFRGVGIEIGQITNRTLALASGLEGAVAGDELAALVSVGDDGYTLSYLLGGEILLYRYKAFGDENEELVPADSVPRVEAGAVRRDLRLTSSFVRQNFPERALGRLFLAAPERWEPDWLDWLADELDVAPEPIGFEHFALARTQAEESWLVTGPHLGAASIEVPSRNVVNLARRPFVNERPVVRLAALLWAAAIALLVWNVYSYSTYWADSAEVRTELSGIRQEIETEKASFADFRDEFAGIELDELNERAAFLNQLIRNRTFPWSRLFDDLEEVLTPHYEIRLDSVQPELDEGEKRASGRRSRAAAARRRSSSSRGRSAPPQEPPPTADEPDHDEIVLKLRGVSQSDDAILDLVDTLFAHPAFRDPNFQRESVIHDTSLVTFDMDVIYRLDFHKPGAEAEAEQGADAEAGVSAAAPDVTAGPVAGDSAAAESEADDRDEDSARLTQAPSPGVAVPPPPPVSRPRNLPSPSPTVAGAPAAADAADEPTTPVRRIDPRPQRRPAVRPGDVNAPIVVQPRAPAVTGAPTAPSRRTPPPPVARPGAPPAGTPPAGQEAASAPPPPREAEPAPPARQAASEPSPNTETTPRDPSREPASGDEEESTPFSLETASQTPRLQSGGGGDAG